MTLTVGSLFSGYGGLDLAVVDVFPDSRVAWHSEVDANASTVLAHHWPDVPNLGDITAVDWSTVEPVDVICGGFPCQDISSAGRGAGITEGTRSGLWHRYADAVRVLRPRLVFVENVSALAVRGLDIVTGSLAAIGYDCRWLCLRASDVGACHRRERLFLVAWPADAADLGCERVGGAWHRGTGPADGGGAVANTDHAALDGQRARPEPGRRGAVAADARSESIGHSGGAPEREATERGEAGDHARNGDPSRFGPYADAVARWEHATRRPAPDPTDDRGRLSPRFVEWMMGLPAGWVTDRGLSRSAELKMLGNGVVPQQGAAALRLLLDPVRTLAAAS